MTHIIRTALIQARADLRATLFSSSVVGFLLGPAIIILTSYLLSDEVADNISISVGAVMLVGSIGAFSSIIIIQINSEMYSESLDGTLLRVRTLPRGALSWALGKTLSNVTIQLFMQVVILVGAFFSLPHIAISPLQWLTALILVFLAIFACAPVGFILGSFLHGIYSQLLIYLLAIAALASSGAFFPITLLPTWAQYLHLVLPFYWAGSLSRWALLGADAAAFDFTTTPHPLLAVAVLVAWTVLGFLLASWSINRSFRKLSLSSLASMQSAMRAQLGV